MRRQRLGHAGEVRLELHICCLSSRGFFCRRRTIEHHCFCSPDIGVGSPTCKEPGDITDAKTKFSWARSGLGFDVASFCRHPRCDSGVRPAKIVPYQGVCGLVTVSGPLALTLFLFRSLMRNREKPFPFKKNSVGAGNTRDLNLPTHLE